MISHNITVLALLMIVIVETTKRKRHLMSEPHNAAGIMPQRDRWHSLCHLPWGQSEALSDPEFHASAFLAAEIQSRV
jgi:hypothetical protein